MTISRFEPTFNRLEIICKNGDILLRVDHSAFNRNSLRYQGRVRTKYVGIDIRTFDTGNRLEIGISYSLRDDAPENYAEALLLAKQMWPDRLAETVIS